MEIVQCRKCGSNDLEERIKGPHIGVYCKKCGAWLGWKTKEKHTNTQTINEFCADACKQCGSTNMIEKACGPHIGLYCADCGKWYSWKATKGREKHTQAYDSNGDRITAVVQNIKPNSTVPALVKGTERMSLFLNSIGTLSLNIDDQEIPIVEVQGIEMPKKIYITIGTQTIEMPYGSSLNVYVV
jgi:ribosomal protein L40E